jgi:hypothetical protein
MAIEVNELTANEWCFLSLGAGLTLDKNDKVIFKKDLADRMRVELGDKVTLSNTYTFTFVDADVSVLNNTITENSHGMLDGQIVQLRTTGVLPSPFAINTLYYVVQKTANNFKLSLTSGGAAIDILSAAGGGTHTVVKLAASLQYSNFAIVRA